MKNYQDVGVEVMIEGGIVPQGNTAEGSIDTIGANDLAVNFLLGAATDKPTTLKLQESDDDSTYADIPSCVGDDPNGFPIPAGDPANPQSIRINLSLNGHMRYIKAVVVPGETGGQSVAVSGSLHTPHDSTEIRARNAVTVDAY